MTYYSTTYMHLNLRFNNSLCSLGHTGIGLAKKITFSMTIWFFVIILCRKLKKQLTCYLFSPLSRYTRETNADDHYKCKALIILKKRFHPSAITLHFDFLLTYFFNFSHSKKSSLWSEILWFSFFWLSFPLYMHYYERWYIAVECMCDLQWYPNLEKSSVCFCATLVESSNLSVSGPTHIW